MSGAEQTEAVGLGNMPELIAFLFLYFKKLFILGIFIYFS